MDSSSHNKPTNTKHHQPTSSELLSSAQYVAAAAKAQLNHDQTQKLDKDKLGAAAGHLFEAASHYGKLEEKGYGKYVDKAETYLHQYHSSSHSSTGSGESAPPTTTKHNTSSPQEGESESGFGDYLKMAQGFMKK